MKTESKQLIFDDPQPLSLKRKMLLPFYGLISWGYKTLMRLAKKDSAPRKYKVAICSEFKDEGPYLREWIEYHKIVGIDHFYMYDNNSSDNFKAVLAPYVKEGTVTLIHWPKPCSQMECYETCINDYGKETEWLGFIDADEFIVPHRPLDNVYDFLKQFKNRGSVSIYWKMFGTSGLVKRDLSSPVIKDFTVCWDKYSDIGKCFYNTRFAFCKKKELKSCLHHNLWTHGSGRDLPPVNVFDRVICLGQNKAKSSAMPIQINHYFTKSFEEYLAKTKKGDVYFEVNPHDLEYFFKHEGNNCSSDFSAYRFLTKLQLALGKREKLGQDG